MPSELFGEFPPTSTEAWEARIREDLGEADYGEVMLWHTDDDFTLRAYYRSEDLEDVEHLRTDLPPCSIPRTWRIRQDIATHDLADAKIHIRQALEGGIEVLGLHLDVQGGRLTGVNIQAQDDLKYLLDGLSLAETSFHLDAGLQSPALAAMLVNLVGSVPARLTLGFDPVGNAVHSGSISEGAVSLARDLIEGPNGFRPLSIDATVFHEAGATTVQETGLLLASLAEHLVLLIDKGAR
ncbi:MAG: methylmalonyl-CoA mutase family protein, partial [Rhodothermales bacterium]